MAYSQSTPLYPPMDSTGYSTPQNGTTLQPCPPYSDPSVGGIAVPSSEPPPPYPLPTPPTGGKEPITVAVPLSMKPGQDLPPEYNFGENNYIQYVPMGAPMPPKLMFFNNQQGRVFAADFFPECVQQGNKSRQFGPQFEPFSCLIQQANFWLAQNPIFSLISCESVERDCSFAGVIDTVSNVRFESAFGMRLFVRGLRLWVRQEMNPNAAQAAPKQIWYINVMPRYTGQTSSLISFEFSCSSMVAFGRSNYLPMNEFCLPQFEDMKTTLNKFSESLKTCPLQGELLTVEVLRLSLPMRATGPMDLDQSYWSEVISQRRTFLNCFRIFYIHGPPTQPNIGLELFSPDVKFRSGMGRAVIEDFDAVSNRAMSWTLGHSNYKNVNYQTISSFYNFFDPTMLQGMGVTEPTVDGNRSIHVAFSNRTVHLISSVAVFYVDTTCGTTSEFSPMMAPGGFLTMSCKTFIPCKVNKGTYESTAETISRIGEWLNVSNSVVANMETIEVYHNPVNNNVRFLEMGRQCPFGIGMTKLTCFRFYFYGPYYEPNPSMLTRVPDFKRKSKDSDVCHLS